MRIRVGTAVAIGIAALVAVSLGTGLWGRAGQVTTVVQDQTLVEKVKLLQDELKQKDVALSVQEKRLKELEEQPTLAAGEQPPTLDGGAHGRLEPLAPKKSEGPLVALHESESPGIGLSGTTRKPTSQTEIKAERAGQRPEPEPSEPSGPIINFNAQGVTAVADGPNKGTLSFRLIKDQQDIRFSGYLFVFVEMGEGEDSRIYAYPQRAQLGDGYLPSDYREGESVSFKINSRVELPYKDVRSGAALSRVSILLYGQDGNIVFQRGFDRKEVKTLSAKSHPAENARQKGTDKRQAL
jgi:hypothetical protein